MAETTPKATEAPVKTELEQAVDVLDLAEAQLKELLADKHEIVLINMSNQFNVMRNRIRMMGGMQLHHEIKTNFAPVTEFMGDKIERGKKVQVKELTPKEQEIKNLTDKADKLQGSLAKLKNEQILESYKADQAPIRVLAKRAGLEDYKDAEINSPYLDLIRNGFEEQAKQKALSHKDSEITNQ